MLVATEQDKVYGLQAETGAQQWVKSLGTAWQSSEISCGDLAPTIGATATPVIDPATNVAYMTHKSYVSGSSGPVRWYMDAIEMTTGAEKPGFPVELSGTAQNAPGVSFSAKTELQRPGLLLLEGVVYAGFGSDCDVPPFQGWVFGVSESGVLKSRWTTETASSGGGIWQSGAGLTSDGPGTLLLATGNGDTPAVPTPGSEPPGTLGEAVVRLRVQPDGTLKATDFFAPFDAATLASWDADFGSGGVTGLPSEYFGTPAIPHLAVIVGKDGYVYLLNRDNLGGIGEGPGGSDRVVQRLGPYGGVWSRPGVWPGEGGWIYIPTASNGTTAAGSSGNLRVYSYGLSGEGTPALSLAATSKDAFGFSSGAPVITSQGTKSGSALVWMEWAPNGTGVGAQLRAYAPTPSDGEPVLLWSAPIGTSSKFATPGVGGGRLYVGTRDGHVLAFGAPVTSTLSGEPTEFPATTLGSQSTKTATLTANREVSVTKLGSSSAQFLIGETTPALPATLKAGEKLKVAVTFAPTEAGPQAATLTATTSTGETLPFSLSGIGQASGPKLEAAPTVLTFGGTTIGGHLSGTASFRNVGASALKIESVLLPDSPFTITGAPAKGAELAAGHSITIPVEFSPTETGSFESAILVKSTGGEEQVRLTGSAATPGVLSIAPESSSFGHVPVGGEATRSFTVANTGGSGITIFKSKPPTEGPFTATSSLPEDTTISPGEVLTETVRFAPSTTGAASATWLINGEGSSAVHEVSFSGVGGEAEPLSPPPPSTIITPPGPGTGSVLGFRASAFGALLTSASLRAASSGTVPARLRCPLQAVSCTGTITLRTARPVRLEARERRALVRTLATASFKLAGGHSRTLLLHIAKALRGLLAHARTTPLIVTLRTRDANGATSVLHSSARLSAPARFTGG